MAYSSLLLLLLSHFRSVWLCATLWTSACQPPLSVGSLGKNTRVGSHAHLQGIFSTRGLNPGLLHCRQILYRWATREAHSSLPGPKPTLGSFGSDFKAHCCVLSQFPDSKWLNYHLTTSKVTLKILQARFQQYMNHELPDVQDGFRKGRGTRDQIANIRWIIKKARVSRKTSTSALLTTSKPFTVWITTNCGKFWKRWEYQTTWPVSQEICMQVKKQQLELGVEQQTGSKSGKEYVKAVYCLLI